MGANGVYLVSLVKSVSITINRSILKTVFDLKFNETAPPSFTRKMAKNLYLTHFACPQKLAAYKCQNRTPPYHVLFPEPRLLHYVFVCIFHPKYHSKEAYNEVALESIYRLINGYSVDYASILVSYILPPEDGNMPLSSTSVEATALQVPLPDPPTLHALWDSLESLREDYTELHTQMDLIYTDMGLLGKKLDELIHMTYFDRATHAANRIIQSTSSDPHFI
ncbi:hypothetical protein Cgig2_023917 [Carnegiea gigantea]|uniref:Uncharacterized protein n=1 Tax=Carnegiea gigantea TaxID=171969 RepID=A0A9Q1JN06_9CARY|nr:hypothetical protein Cgig2_023917 [Carnegiea gigantea]